MTREQDFVDYSIISIAPDGTEHVDTGLSSKKPPSLARATKIRDDWAEELDPRWKLKVAIDVYIEGHGWEPTGVETPAVKGRLR